MEITGYLIAGMLIVSLFQPTKQRLVIAVFFSLACIGHAIVSENLASVLYWLPDRAVIYILKRKAFLCYFTAGAVDLLAIVGVLIFATPTRFTDCFIMACLAFLLVNTGGWIIYDLGLDPAPYDVALAVMYVGVSAILLAKEGGDGRKIFGLVRLPCYKGLRSHLPLYRKS